MFKMYLASIEGLEDASLQKQAMLLLDPDRQECVHKCKKEKDRMRAIAAGLLLQAGFSELELENTDFGELEKTDPERLGLKKADFGELELENVGLEALDVMQDETACGSCYYITAERLTKELMQRQTAALPLQYEKNKQGKPFWNKKHLAVWKPDKKLWHFNLSHSGEYVLLVVADTPVGVDIQQAREAKYYPGGYRAFSRMEAFVKCTGEGYAKGHARYDAANGNVPGYAFLELATVEGYAGFVCRERKDGKICEI